jgi:hypothetical protein
MATRPSQKKKSIVNTFDPMEEYNQICSFCLRPAIEVDLEDLSSGYMYSATLGNYQRSLIEIWDGVALEEADDILELGMRYDSFIVNGC